MKIKAKQYAESLYEMVKDKDVKEIDCIMGEFIHFLAKQGKTKILAQVKEELESLVDTAEGTTRVHAVLAKEDPHSEKALLVELKKTLGKDIEVETQYDPAIIGGVILTIGDTRVDASIAHQLERLKNALQS